MVSGAMRTIARPATVDVTVTKSRFIARAERVDTEAAARGHIAAARKRHPGARHHCGAFVVGARGEVSRSSDDGEPSGTAGAPILAAVHAAGLTDVAVVVARYFGGVKLGTGGLARAYGAAASAAIAAAGVVELRRLDVVEVRGDYAACGGLEAQIRGTGGRVTSVDYGQMVCVVVACDDAAAFTAWVAQATSGRAATRHTGTTVIDVPV
ncbi:MAG TPA: YigZ family protein [Stackebrandtia sp.]|jgi:uncharacterized YigZ family protein|uniref:IMPACT family protein n=1 Tax=Stackebrandtia sp. TaxID=2023065 RepID=UPI002D371377|nr:YigZ family protein [Stackebrandtia sp.]HZE41678.1 YigZ family protein [Stackebrandtia sp.]